MAAATVPSSASPAAPAANTGPAASAPAAAPLAPSGRHRPPRCTYPVRHADLDLFVSPSYLARPGWVALAAQLSRSGRRSCPVAGATISFYRAGGRGGRLVGSAVTGESGFAVTTSYVRRTSSFYAVGGGAGSGVVTVTVVER